jgi:hypothetical protein
VTRAERFERTKDYLLTGLAVTGFITVFLFTTWMFA